jgi:hypothetical protein
MASPTPSRNPQGDNHAPRPWLGIHFNCCNVYARIYKRPGARVYTGRCPRCGAPLSVPIGPEGTHSRFFETT